LRSSAVEFGSLDVDSLEDLLIEQGLLDNYWQQMSQIYTKRAFEREKIVDDDNDDNNNDNEVDGKKKKSFARRRFSRKKK